MAVIDGKIPVAAGADIQPTLVVKLGPGEKAAALAARADMAGSLAEAAPGAMFRPYFADARESAGRIPAPFDRYLSARFPDRAEAEKSAARLRGLANVTSAYVEGGPTPPPEVNASDDPRAALQGYLDAAPDGIDARWAWDECDGSGIRFVDVEQGWTLDHEDLAAAGITLISGVNNAYPGHGTAVLGEIAAVDNMRGCVGIAPGVDARVVSQWRTASSYGTAEAILSAADALSNGDVMLLEAQTTIAGSTASYLPVEVEDAVFDAIVHAVGRGISVVEAGGNGGNDLDAWRDVSNHARLDPDSSDFRDSGAIMVGAAGSAAPHGRLSFSNFGARIDCFGWGAGVSTTGDGWTGTSTTAYTDSFGGTSGASPIVTGAAILVQSWLMNHGHPVYPPAALRAVLSDPALNTASAASTDRIGVMPNMRAIIEAEKLKPRLPQPHFPQYLSLVHILFGILNDAPGWIWVPGKGPVPIDPGWGRAIRAMPRDRRELVQAFVTHEMAAGLAGRDAAGIRRAAISAMREAVKSIAASDGRSG